MGYCPCLGDCTMKRSTSVFIIYFGIIVCSLIFRIAFNSGFASNMSDFGSDAVWTMITQVGIFGIMPFTLYFITNKKGNPLEAESVFTDFGFKKTSFENIALTLPITILLVYVVTCFVLFYSIMLGFMGYTKVQSETNYDNIGILIGELVFTAMLPAFFEDFTHRGLLFAGIKDATNKPVVLILLSSVLFGLMHQNIQQVFYTCIAGSVMALATYYSGSIWCGILVHFFNNAISIMEDFLYKKSALFHVVYDKIFEFLTGNLFGLLIAFTMFAGSVVSIIFILRHMRSQGKVKGILLDKSVVKKFTPVEIAIITATILLGVGTTAFSLVWGIMR